MISKWINKIIGGVVTLVISFALLPVLQESIDGLNGTGMVYENTTVGTLLDIVPMVIVVVLVVLAVALIPKSN